MMTTSTRGCGVTERRQKSKIPRESRDFSGHGRGRIRTYRNPRLAGSKTQGGTQKGTHVSAAALLADLRKSPGGACAASGRETAESSMQQRNTSRQRTRGRVTNG